MQGFDTSGKTMCFALTVLADNKNVQVSSYYVHPKGNFSVDGFLYAVLGFSPR